MRELLMLMMTKMVMVTSDTPPHTHTLHVAVELVRVHYVLCTRTVKFWNLETMRLSGTVNGVYSPIRSADPAVVVCHSHDTYTSQLSSFLFLS